MAQIMAIVLVIIATLIGSPYPILLKKASNKINLSALSSFRKFISATAGNIPLVIAVIVFGISFVVYSIALRGADLSLVYPLVSLSYLWVSFLSVKYLNERMTTTKWAGVIVIIAGAFMVGLGS